MAMRRRSRRLRARRVHRKVAAREGVDEQHAIRRALAVDLVLREAVTTGEMDDVRGRPKPEHEELFGRQGEGIPHRARASRNQEPSSHARVTRKRNFRGDDEPGTYESRTTPDPESLLGSAPV